MKRSPLKAMFLPCVQRPRRTPRPSGRDRHPCLHIQQGRIASLRSFGDFTGRADGREIKARLCGLAYERDVVVGAVSAVDPTDYFGDVIREDLPNLRCP